MEANRTSPWPLIVVPFVSVGTMILGLIAASLDKPARTVAETLLSLATRWYC
jgi:hypothetical protein